MLLVCVGIGVGCASTARDADLDLEDWVSLFNGRDLAGWTVKIAGHDLGENFANTFRVEDGVLSVRYDGYGDFDGQFGHLFYDESFSHYRLAIEYRFVGDQQPGAPSWAFRNSGVMLHSQDPQTIPRDQDFPISVEVQFLGGPGDGERRPTANMCSPGTDIIHEGQIADRHCIDSRSDTFDGDQWVRVEAIVLGDSHIVHLVNGDTVLQYSKPHIGGGVVDGYDPAVKKDGTPLTAGFIALQSEGHSLDFRLVELLNLKGCTDLRADNFKRYYVESDPEACR